MKKFLIILVGIIVVISLLFIVEENDNDNERQFITILAEPAVDEENNIIPEESLFYIGYQIPWHRMRYITIIENLDELDTASVVHIRSTSDGRLSFPKYKKYEAEEICAKLAQKRLIDYQY